jgi:signal transduction histidine kinase
MLLIMGGLVSVTQAQLAPAGAHWLNALDSFLVWPLWAGFALWFGKRSVLPRADRRARFWISSAALIIAVVGVVELISQGARSGVSSLLGGTRPAPAGVAVWWSAAVLELVVAGALIFMPLGLRRRLDPLQRGVAIANLERRRSQARMQFLVAQLTPHFLFNSLNGVLALLEEDREAASAMLVDLTAFVRQVFEQEHVSVITVAEELRLLDSYLAVQRWRFPDELDFQSDVDPSALELSMPSLLLQPLIENAVRHGIMGSRLAVRLHIQRADDRLAIRVENTGREFRGSSTERIGLTNSRERLTAIYGERQSLQLQSAPGGGTIVTIDIPAVHSEGRQA